MLFLKANFHRLQQIIKRETFQNKVVFECIILACSSPLWQSELDTTIFTFYTSIKPKKETSLVVFLHPCHVSYVVLNG